VASWLSLDELSGLPGELARAESRLEESIDAFATRLRRQAAVQGRGQRVGPPGGRLQRPRVGRPVPRRFALPQRPRAGKPLTVLERDRVAESLRGGASVLARTVEHGSARRLEGIREGLRRLQRGLMQLPQFFWRTPR
jgi:hypothetical protein